LRLRREVIDKDAEAVLDEVEAAMLAVATTIVAGDGFAFDIPSRAKGNQMYVGELDRIVLREAMSKRHFANTQTCRRVPAAICFFFLRIAAAARRRDARRRNFIFPPSTPPLRRRSYS
jgi:meiotic recombination protein SPO11